MAERQFRISVVAGPLNDHEDLISEPLPDVLVSGDCVGELFDIEDAEPQRCVYRCACSRRKSGARDATP